MYKLYNDVLIPKLGLGTFRMTNEDELIKVVHSALDVGYRHFDTAQMYHNEASLGLAFEQYNIPRSELFITSKLMQHHNSETTKAMIMKSLSDLKTDYLDLLLIHWPNHDDEINYKTWQIFEELYADGYLKAIGVSNFTRYQLEQLIKKAKIKPMVNQIEMHPGLAQVALKKYLDEREIALISYGPFMKGQVFTDDAYVELKTISKKYNATVAQIVIAWGLARNIPMIPKTATISRLSENFSAINVKLKSEDVDAITKLSTGRRVYSDPSNNVYGYFVK